MEMERSGQTGEILVGTGHEVRGSFTLLQKHNIDRQSAPCVQDPGTITLRAECILGLKHKVMHCRLQLDWVPAEPRGEGCWVPPGLGGR